MEDGMNCLKRLTLNIIPISFFVCCFYCFALNSCNVINSFEQDSIIDVEGQIDTNISYPHYIVVFGDIQYYIQGYSIYYYNLSLEWIKEQLLYNDICAVLEVGDITQNNTDNQWNVFREATLSLANDLPFFVCTGNHDYEWKEEAKIHDRNSTLINQYAHFSKSDNSILYYYERNSLENYVAQIRVGKDYLYLLALEFGPRKQVLNWAVDIVKHHKDKRFLLMTHEWLSATGERMSSGTHAELQFDGYSPYSTPEEIWNILVKNNDNIIAVLCGHEKYFSCMLLSENDYGREVPQIMFNLQFLPNGGDGIIQIWKICDNDYSFDICAIDTKTGERFLPDSTSYRVPFRYMSQDSNNGTI